MGFSQEMRDCVAERLPKMNDYSFIDPAVFSAMIDELMSAEYAYIEGLTPDADGELDYDDDAAFDSIFAHLSKKFPDYKMYCMSIAEDYMEVSEAYMNEHNEIDWE